jgi:hypothetical protein
MLSVPMDRNASPSRLSNVPAMDGIVPDCRPARARIGRTRRRVAEAKHVRHPPAAKEPPSDPLPLPLRPTLDKSREAHAEARSVRHAAEFQVAGHEERLRLLALLQHKGGEAMSLVDDATEMWRAQLKESLDTALAQLRIQHAAQVFNPPNPVAVR